MGFDYNAVFLMGSFFQVSEHKIKGKSITVKKADVKPGKVNI